MNTCQTSIKIDVLFIAAVTHIPGYRADTRLPQWFPANWTIMNVSDQTELRISQIRIVDRLLKLP